MTLFIISFISGMLTVLAPCILPLLPVIVGGSVSEGRANFRKALVVTGSLGASVILFTILLKISTLFITIPPEVWRWVSGSIIILFGIFAFFPNLFEKISGGGFFARLNRKSNVLLAQGYKKQSVWGDVLIGAALGPVFSTCSPTYFIVLATVLPESFATAMLYLLAYTIGLCLMLLLIAVLGQKLVSRLGGAADPSGWFKRGLGILFIVVGLAVFTGYDKKLEVRLLEAGLFDVTKLEQKLLEYKDTVVSDEEKTHPGISGMMLTEEQKNMIYKKAAEISSPNGFINTGAGPDGKEKPITIGELTGKKVVLLDIWTFSCINCQRTLPYLNAWYEKYAGEDFEIIGLHTPEFAFEGKVENVRDAAQRFGVKYPIVLDNDYSTWNAYGNSFWPRKYLIDIDGYIVYDHIGEGAYEETEEAIRRAVSEARARKGGGALPKDTTKPEGAETASAGVRSPEIYFGAFRNERLGNGTVGKMGEAFFTRPTTLLRNTLYLTGRWNVTEEYAESRSAGASIVFPYSAQKVFMVAGANSTVRAKVLLDGKPPGARAGSDVDENGYITIQEERLYRLLEDTAPGEHTIEIIPESPGLKAFTFTFG